MDKAEMTTSKFSNQDENFNSLLQDIAKVIADNRRFVKSLAEDNSELQDEITDPQSLASEDEFEEL